MNAPSQVTSQVAAWRYSSNAKSILGVKRRRAWLVLGWVTIWGVEVSVKLHTLEPRSAQSREFLSGVKGKVPPGTSVRRSIFREESKAVTRP